jgi:mycothiol synthase
MTEQATAGGKIEVEGAPEIQGLSFRHFGGEADFAQMVEVADASRAADQVEEVDTVEVLARRYSNMKNFDPYRDVIVVEVDGRMVGWRHMTWWEELDGTRIYHHFGYLAPEARGKGLERALVRYCEDHLRTLAGDYPRDKRLVDTWTADSEKQLVEALVGEGYRPTRHFYEMVRPDLENIRDAPLPEGIEVRPARPEEYRAIWEAEAEAFRDHWGEAEVDESDFERWQRSNYFQPHMWQVAWEGDQVAGMVRGFIDEDYNARYGRKRGYTENISVRRPWRKRGLASALMALSLQQQKELGLTESSLGVDTENTSGALRVYENMGFRAVKRFTVYRKPLG